MKDDSDMHMFDLVIVLVRSRSDFDSPDEDVFEFSFVIFCCDGIKESSKVGVVLDIESCIQAKRKRIEK